MVVRVNSPENLKRSVDTCIAALRGMKKIDLFECARVDPKYRIEDTLQVLSGFVKERKFDHIGLSECSAETVRRANKVTEMFTHLQILFFTDQIDELRLYPRSGLLPR